MSNIAQNNYTGIGEELKQELMNQQQPAQQMSPLRIRRQAVQQLSPESQRSLEIYERGFTDAAGGAENAAIDELLDNPQMLATPEGVAALDQALMAWDQSRTHNPAPDPELMNEAQYGGGPSPENPDGR